MLIHKRHAMPMPHRAMVLRSCFKNGMVVAWHGHGKACVNQTWPHCVNYMGKTQSKPSAARHGREMVCVKLALTVYLHMPNFGYNILQTRRKQILLREYTGGIEATPLAMQLFTH
jgi:hypothetical protein